MSGTALFMGPMARKKRTHLNTGPNSYRVISSEAESIPTIRASYESEPSYFPPIVSPSKTNTSAFGQPLYPKQEHRKNRPNPNHVGFLRQDVRLLNEPVCDVYTASSEKEQYKWWPSRTSKEPLKIPPHTLDSTVREDYQYRGGSMRRNTRHGSNTDIKSALGSVPVNHLREPNGEQRVWKEGLSYEHQYNCRLDPSYPIRGKRHGSFVWDRFSSEEVDRMRKSYEQSRNASPIQQISGSGVCNQCLTGGSPVKEPDDPAYSSMPVAAV